jgi:serine/threonine-protein kinase
MSPEQVTGKSLDGRADLFSLGVMAYHLLTGVPPFSGRNTVSVAYQIVHSTPPLPSSIVPDLPHAIDRVMARILAKDPDERYGSGREFADEFTRVLMGLPADHRTAKVPKPWRGKHDPRLLALIGIGIVVSGIVLVSYGGRRAGAPDLENASASVRDPRAAVELARPVPAPPAKAKAAQAPVAKTKPGAVPGSGVRAKPAGKPAPAAVEPKPAEAATAAEARSEGVPEAGSPQGADAPTVARVEPPHTSAARNIGAPRATGFMAFELGTRMRGGTLVVALDGRPILTEAFEKKNRLLPYQTTSWPEIEVPAGRHQLTARIESAKGEIKVSAPLTVEVEPAQTLNLRLVLKDDSVVFKSGS